MKRDYYLHRSGGRKFDYFGGIGTPFRVSFLRYIVMKALKYKATSVPHGTPLVRVIIRAALKAGAHRRSWKVQQIKKLGYDRG